MSDIKKLVGRVQLELCESSSNREATAAFQKELGPYFDKLVDKAVDQATDTFTEIMDGKWPSSQLKQMVLRYKPPAVSEEDFVEALYDLFSGWADKKRR